MTWRWGVTPIKGINLSAPGMQSEAPAHAALDCVIDCAGALDVLQQLGPR